MRKDYKHAGFHTRYGGPEELIRVKQCSKVPPQGKVGDVSCKTPVTIQSDLIADVDAASSSYIRTATNQTSVHSQLNLTFSTEEFST